MKTLVPKLVLNWIFGFVAAECEWKGEKGGDLYDQVTQSRDSPTLALRVMWPCI